MRSGNGFIECANINTGRHYIINTASIIYVLESENSDHAVIVINNGDRGQRIVTKETYDEVIHAVMGIIEYRQSVDYIKFIREQNSIWKQAGKALGMVREDDETDQEDENGGNDSSDAT